MEKLSNSKLLFSWFTGKWRVWGSFVLFAGILLLVCWLSSVDLEPVLYSIGICLFLGMGLLCYDFYIFMRQYKTLVEQFFNLDVAINQSLNKNQLMEKTYYALLQELFQRRYVLQEEMNKRETESTNYYTLWIHQIKTPIAAMRLLLQSKDEKTNNLLLEQELFKVEHYAEMALHYFRLNNMSSDLLLGRCNLNEIIKQSVKKYSISFIEKRLSLSYEDLTVNLISDERWLSFIIEQILSNCIKYTAEGGISIEFVYEPEPTLIIEDTGIGIQPEDLPRIFDKGFTGYNGRMDQKSTGIGLYLCKQAIERLGYRISVTSQVGVGSRFEIYFNNTSPTLQ